MMSVPSVKCDIATTLTFPQTLRKAEDALILAAPGATGITGLTKAMVASVTIDAILKAAERDPGAPESGPAEAHQRFDLGETAADIETAPGRETAAAVRAAPTEDAGKPPPVTAGQQGAASASPSPDSAETARASGADHAAEAAIGPPLRDALVGETPGRPVVDLSQNGALLRELAGQMTARARSPTPTRIRLGFCPRCGESRMARPCACPPARRRATSRF